MFIFQLIGRQAGQVIEVPAHVAQSCTDMGTARYATDEEVAESGLELPMARDTEAEPEEAPPGYTIETLDGGGYNVIAPDQMQINEEPFRNLPAARSAAFGHLENGTLADDDDASQGPSGEKSTEKPADGQEQQAATSIPDASETPATGFGSASTAHPMIDIPADWAVMHHLKQINLAKQIDPAITTKAEAVAAIEAYLSAKAE